jgi:hypothetical protein
MAKSGEFDEVWLDTRISIATQQKVIGTNEPDVLGLNFDKMTARAVEIPSPSQIQKSGKYTSEFNYQIDQTRIAFMKHGWSIEVWIVRP